MKKRTYSILIIDDAFFLRNLIKKAIAKKPNEELDYDFEILTEAQNGEEGLELYQIVKPDIVTVDINMPKLNGIEFIKKLKKLNPYSKIIVISANLASEYKDKVIEAGAFSYIQKPFQDAYLWSRLDAIAEELKKESFNISKFSSDNNISNVAIPNIKNKKTKPNIQSNKKENEEGADLLSSIVKDGKTTETIKNVHNNSHNNKKKENKNYPNKDNKNKKVENKEVENKEDSFSFLDSFIVKDDSSKKTDNNKNINNKKSNNNKKNYVHKKDESKKYSEKVNKPLDKTDSLENKNIKKNKEGTNRTKDISSKIIEKENDLTNIISKTTNIETVKSNIEEDTDNNSILKDNSLIIDNSKNIEDNQKDELLENKVSENIIIDNTDEEIIINDNEELIIDDNEEVVINDNEDIVIEDNEEIVIEDNEELIIDDNEDIVIDDNEELIIDDNEEIIIEEDDSPIIIDDNEEIADETEINLTNEFEDKSNNNNLSDGALLNINLNKIEDTYSEDINSENYLEENITYDINEFVIPSKIYFNTETEDNNECENKEEDDEIIVNEKQNQTIDYRSPFSSGNAEFILSNESDDYNADIVQKNSYKKENENISYKYNNSSNEDNMPTITPPVNSKYKEIYNEKMEKEYNISFDDVIHEEPKEEKKLGFFARLFGGKKKKKDKKKKRK